MIADTYSFNCTACGKCCNSAPLMSLPELLHHENLFVGCLAIRRVKRYQPGESLSAAQAHFSLSPSDAADMAGLAESLFFDPGREGSGFDLAIQTQALDYESLKQCPALGADNRCSIHDDRKPSVCSMVPFDSLFPDRLQQVVLASRNLGENCIVEGIAEGFDVLVKDRQIIHEGYRKAAEQRRLDLIAEKQNWGEAVFSMLRPALFADSGLIQSIPYDGHYTLSIIPVLIAIAGVSDPCRQRTLQYVDSQISLIDAKVRLAIQRKQDGDKPTTKELRGFKEAYLKFRPELLADKLPFSALPERVTALEKYLGVSGKTCSVHALRLCSGQASTGSARTESIICRSS